METTSQGRIVHDYNVINYVATDPLPRDQAQSTRLHEPEQMLTSIDPITGRAFPFAPACAGLRGRG